MNERRDKRNSQQTRGTTARMRRYPRAAGLIVLCVSWLGAARVNGQTVWEVTPYRLQVWFVMEDDARIPTSWQQTLPEQIDALTDARIGAVWDLRARMAPASLAVDFGRDRFGSLDEIAEVEPAARDEDKIMVVRLSAVASGYAVAVRELDVPSRTWSQPWEQVVPTAGMLPDRIVALLCDAFQPLLQIERIAEGEVIGVLQAAALTRPAESLRAWPLPTELREGDVLEPFLRKADRTGVVTAAGIEPIDWTVLEVVEPTSGKVRCRFESGYRQPFRTRKSARVSQLARQIKTQQDTTALKLVDRKQPELPLVGYEVYAKQPNSEATELIGRTDWRGIVSIGKVDQATIRVLFIRSGQQLLGKLPLVPGHQSLVTAPLRNDGGRLEAEGFLVGIQDSLVDLVARREILASRIRKLIEDGKVAEAAELLKELRRLATQDDFARFVEQRKQSLSSTDSQVQAKIDQLFVQTRTLLGRYLSQEQVNQLAESLAKATPNQ